MRFQLIVLFALVLVANQKLMFVVEMFRHGARGPVVDFFYDAAQQSYQFDQLTATGQRCGILYFFFLLQFKVALLPSLLQRKQHQHGSRLKTR